MTTKILLHPECLSQSYLPEKLLHRETELQKLRACLDNSLNTFVYGEPRIGKTSLIKCATKDYKGKATYIDCSLYQTLNAVLREILSSVSSLMASRSNYDLLKRLKEKTKNSKTTICLDHFDYLKEVDTINKLLGLGFTLVIVSDKQENYLRLDPFARSSVTNLADIPGYTLEQTITIVSDRAKEALKEWSYSDAIIEKVCEQSKGNIALAMNILKTAAITAENGNKNKIDETDIPESDCPQLELSQDERVLLKVLQEWKSLPSARLYAFYRERAKYPKEERSFRNYMRDLCAKGFVKAIGDKSGRFYEIIEHGDSHSKSNG